MWCSFSEYGKQVTRNGESLSQLLNISLQMCYSHRDEQDRCTMESGVLPYHSFQVSMDWREHGYCRQPKGGKRFGNGTEVVCSTHYAQFFPVSWLSISLGSTKITWRYPSFFTAHFEEASPCCSFDSLSASICHLAHCRRAY